MEPTPQVAEDPRVELVLHADARQLELEFDPALETGRRLDPEAPPSLVISEQGEAGIELLASPTPQHTFESTDLPLRLAIPLLIEKPDAGEFIIDLTFVSREGTAETPARGAARGEQRSWRVVWRRGSREGTDRLRLEGGLPPG